MCCSSGFTKQTYSWDGSITFENDTNTDVNVLLRNQSFIKMHSFISNCLLFFWSHIHAQFTGTYDYVL